MRKQLIYLYLLLSFVSLNTNASPSKITACIISGPSTVCANQLDLYQTDVNNAAYTYQWSITPGSGSILSQSGNTCSIQWGTVGTGTITVNISQNGSPITSCSMVVTIYNIPSPTITPSFETNCNEDPDPGGELKIKNNKEGRPKEDPCSGVCENSTVTYTTPDHPGNTYQWQVNGLNYSSITGQNTHTCTVNWTTASTGTIQITETNAAGCSKTVYKCIIIKKAPVANFTTTPATVAGLITICSGQTVTFKDISTATGNSAIQSWIWDFGDGSGTTTYSAGATVTHQYLYNGSSSYTASLTVVNACGCQNTYKIKVIVNRADVPTLNCPSVVCCDKATKYSITHAQQENPGCGYIWSVTGGFISAPVPSHISDDAIITWDCSATPKTIILTPVGCNGCANPIVYEIAVIASSATINGKTIVCPNSLETYSIPAQPGCNFTWSLSDPSAGNIVAGALTNSVKVEWNSNFIGTVVLSVNYTNTVFGCGGSGSLSITLKPEFDIIVAPTSGVCAGNPVTFKAIIPPSTPVNCSWQINQLPLGTNVYNASSTSAISYSFVAGGDYEIIATDNSGSTCNSPVKIVKTITATPPQYQGTLNGPLSNLCPGQSYMYTATPTSSDYLFYWTATNGTVTPSNGNKVNIVWTANGTINLYQVTKTNPACSSLVKTYSVTMTPPPPCGITGTTNACPNGTFTYSAAAGYNYYTWKITPASAGSIISGQGTSSISIQWHNTYISSIASVWVDIKYCNQLVQSCGPLLVGISPSPVISISPAAANVCRNNSQIFTLTGITSVSSVLWNWGDNTTSNTIGTLSAAHSYSTLGTYNITAVVTGPNGCIGALSNASTTVTVVTAPVISISIGGTNKTILCPGEPLSSIAATFYASVQGGNCTSLSYQWNKNGSPVSGATLSSYLPPLWPASVPATDAYTVTITCGGSPCGVIMSSPVYLLRPASCVPVPPCITTGPPNTSLVWNQTPGSGCGSGNFVYAAPAPGFATSIDFGDLIVANITTNQNGGSIPHTYTSPGVYHALLYSNYPSTSGGNCIVITPSSPVEIIIPVIANINLSGVCNTAGNGYNIIVNDISNKLGTYNITSRTCRLDGGAAQSMSSNSYTFTNVASGVHTVTFTINVTDGSNPYSCSITGNITLAAIATPTITIGPNVPRCVGAPVSLSTSSTNIAGYVWQFGDGTSSLLQNPTHEYQNAAAPTTITLTVTTNQGCVATNTATLTVVPNNLAVTVTSPSGVSPVSICQGAPGPVLNASVTGATGAVTYSWNNITVNNISTAPSITANNQQSDRYTVTVIDNIGCLRNATPFAVNVRPSPVANISGRDEYCLGETILLSADQGTGYTYAWTINGSPAGTGPTLAVSSFNYPPGNIIVGLTVTAGGCSASTTITIKINDNPYVYVSPPFNSQLCAGQPNLITATASGGTTPYAYYWNTVPVPVPTTTSITATNAGLYQVTVIDAKGCKAHDATRVYRVEDFANFMSGCYEYCDDTKFTLVGPKSPSIANPPLQPYNIPYEIVYAYQWYKDGVAIPPTAGTDPDYVVDPSPGPYSGSGQYTLSITSMLPSAGCEKNSLLNYDKSFNVNFKKCCKTEVKILEIKCDKFRNGVQTYQLLIDVYNPYGSNATVVLYSPNGPIYTIPAANNLPNPGNNTIVAYFENAGNQTGEVCITGGNITDKETGESCDFELQDHCIKLPICEGNPCFSGSGTNCVGNCIPRNPTVGINCSRVIPPAPYTYAYDVTVSFDWNCRTLVIPLFTSTCGQVVGTTPNIVYPGSNTITFTLYTNQPPGTNCSFLMTLINVYTGEEYCHVCFSEKLVCEEVACFSGSAVQCIGSCIARTPVPYIYCSPKAPQPPYSYAFDVKLEFDWLCRNAVKPIITSSCGQIDGLYPDIIYPGSNGMSFTLSTNSPVGTFCNFIVIMYDAQTGEQVCQFCFRARLTCGRRPGNEFTKNNITGFGNSNNAKGLQNIPAVKTLQSKQVELNRDFSLVPNPAGNFTTINYKFKNAGNNTIMIYDLLGKPLKTFTGLPMAGSLKVDLGSFTSGTYFVKGTGKDQMLIARLVVAR